jgi:hypothetical protein
MSSPQLPGFDRRATAELPRYSMSPLVGSIATSRFFGRYPVKMERSQLPDSLRKSIRQSDVGLIARVSVAAEL